MPFNNTKLKYVRLYGKELILSEMVLHSEIDIAMHALRYDFVNNLFYLLHYRRHGVT